MKMGDLVRSIGLTITDILALMGLLSLSVISLVPINFWFSKLHTNMPQLNRAMKSLDLIPMQQDTAHTILKKAVVKLYIHILEYII